MTVNHAVPGYARSLGAAKPPHNSSCASVGHQLVDIVGNFPKLIELNYGEWIELDMVFVFERHQQLNKDNRLHHHVVVNRGAIDDSIGWNLGDLRHQGAQTLPDIGTTDGC